MSHALLDQFCINKSGLRSPSNSLFTNAFVYTCLYISTPIYHKSEVGVVDTKVITHIVALLKQPELECCDKVPIFTMF